MYIIYIYIYIYIVFKIGFNTLEAQRVFFKSKIVEGSHKM